MPSEGPRRARRAVVAAAPPTATPVYTPVPVSAATSVPAVRPLGVVLLAVLQFLTAAFFGVVALGALIAAAAGNFFIEQFGKGSVPGWVQSGIALIGALAAILFIALLIIMVLLGRGTLHGRPWAWTVNLVWGIVMGAFGIIGLVDSLGNIGRPFFTVGDLFAQLVWAALMLGIVYYLYTPAVKLFFGKERMRAFWQRGPTTPGP